jgi:hypothetical protein
MTRVSTTYDDVCREARLKWRMPSNVIWRCQGLRNQQCTFGMSAARTLRQGSVASQEARWGCPFREIVVPPSFRSGAVPEFEWRRVLACDLPSPKLLSPSACNYGIEPRIGLEYLYGCTGRSYCTRPMVLTTMSPGSSIWPLGRRRLHAITLSWSRSFPSRVTPLIGRCTSVFPTCGLGRGAMPPPSFPGKSSSPWMRRTRG